MGEGGFGFVYKGNLANGREVTIKMLKGNKGFAAELDEFQAEAAVISQVHHRHLVGMVGGAIGNEKMMLVFEYVGNKTLQFHLHGSNIYFFLPSDFVNEQSSNASCPCLNWVSYSYFCFES